MPCPTPSEICHGRPRSTENVGPRNDHNEMGVIPRDNSLLRNSHLPSNRRVAMKQLEAFQEYRQALALLRDAKPAEALSHILKAVELEPLDPFYLSYQGVIVAQANQKIAEAEELCQRALRMEPRQSQLYLNLAEVYKVAGRREDACQDRKSTRLNSSHLGISYAV